MSDVKANKALVRRLIDEVLSAGQLEVIDEIYSAELAPRARSWIVPFLQSFSEIRMEVVDLVGEGDRVAGRFLCSGTHTGTWRGHAPTGRRFERVAEVYFFEFEGGVISAAWGLEDTSSRFRQLGLRPANRKFRVGS